MYSNKKLTKKLRNKDRITWKMTSRDEKNYIFRGKH